MKKIIWCTFAVLLAGMFVHAELVNYTFSGQITGDASWNRPEESWYEAWTPLSCTIAFDLSQGVEHQYQTGTYTNIVQSLWVNTGAETVGGSFPEGFNGWDSVFVRDTSNDTISFQLYVTAGSFGAQDMGSYFLESITFSLTDVGGEVFSDETLPASLDLADFDLANVELRYYSFETFRDYYVYGSMQVGSVPEPATAMMLFFGGGLAFLTNRLRQRASCR